MGQSSLQTGESCHAETTKLGTTTSEGQLTCTRILRKTLHSSLAGAVNLSAIVSKESFTGLKIAFARVISDHGICHSALDQEPWSPNWPGEQSLPYT